MSLTDDMKEALRLDVRSAVHEAVESKVDSMSEEAEEEEEKDQKSESKDKKNKSDDNVSENKDGVDDSDDEDDEDDEDDDDSVNESSSDDAYQKFFQAALKKFGVKSPDELSKNKEKEFYDYVDANWESDKEEKNSDLKEAMEVDAMPANARGKGKAKSMKINRYSDLVKLARSGKYDYFTVKKRNGEETEYSVDRSGKLVEM